MEHDEHDEVMESELADAKGRPDVRHPDADDDEGESTLVLADDVVGCPECGGDGVELGALGRRMWFRCRDCGVDFALIGGAPDA